MTGRALRAFVFVALLAASAAARAEEGAVSLEAEVARIEEPYVAKLEALGQWCGESMLFVGRAAAGEALILIDPEHEKARGWLRYVRQKDRTWKLTSARPFFDEKKELLPEWAQRHAEVAVPLRAELEPLLDRTGDWRTAGVRDRVLRTLVALFPDDESLRRRNGETRVGAVWMLKASADTAAGRRRIRAAADKANKDAASAAPGLERSSSGNVERIASKDFELRARVPRAEALEFAGRILAARDLYRALVDPQARWQARIVQLFGTYAEEQAYFESRKDMDRKLRDFYRKSELFWPTHDEFVLGTDGRARRLDAGVRSVLGTMRSSSGFGLFDAPAWLCEGAGTYLTHALLGTRLTIFVKPDEYSDSQLARELAATDADWIRSARKLVLEQGKAPDLRVLTSLPLNSITREDGLIGYALAAYFLEGCPDEMRGLVENLAAKRSFAESLARVSNVDPDGLELRFVRWLRETK